MARFLGTVEGGRGTASRLGHKVLTTRANGWQGGVKVTLYRDALDEDCALVELTTGSSGAGTVVELYDGRLDAATRARLAAGAELGVAA